MPINTADPETLLQSELFEYQQGALTGVSRDFKGKVLLAEGGTLFLDEISDGKEETYSMTTLTKIQLEELRKFDTPTVSNAIESFNIRSRAEGFMGPEIKCILPYDTPMIGYACTAKISALQAPRPEQKPLIYDYYAHVKETSSPTIAVIQDIDPVPTGSFWGEVHASVHKALGCVATITNGGVRDLDEVKNLGFGYFASCVLVSHAYVHIEEYGGPATFGRLTVHPGDLLHADKHGALLIPHEIAPELAEVCRKIQYAEEPVLKGCREKFALGVELDDLKAWREEMQRRRAAAYQQ